MPDTDTRAAVEVGAQTRIHSGAEAPAPAGSGRAWLACLVPPAGVALVQGLIHLLYHLPFPCDGAEGCKSELLPLGKELAAAAPGVRDGVVNAYDVAARFGWQSTLVLLVALAGVAAVGGTCLLYGSLRDSGARGKWRWIALAAPAAAAGGAAWWAWNDAYMIGSDLLLPLMRKVFGGDTHVAGMVEGAQRYFRVSTVVAVALLALAAGAALLGHGAGPGAPSPAEHLARQSRRLTLTLYAGAALLVAAIVHQTAFFGWAGALTGATVAGVDRARMEAAAQVDSAQATLDRSRARLLGATAELGRARAALAEARGPAAKRAAGKVVGARTADVAGHAAAFRADSAALDAVRFQAGRDTAVARLAAARAEAVSRRVSMVTDAAVSRGGGLVYSLLLAVMYLPGALVLRERARALSGQVAGGEAERKKWREDNGLAFSIPIQWSRVVAVLAPMLASFPAADAILKLFGS
jgi:hypothetical protein